MAESDDILTIRGLSRSFGAQEIIRDLDLSVARGERVALRGPNGAGKTTILRCITGALIPTAGEVRIRQHPAGTQQAKRLVGASLSSSTNKGEPHNSQIGIH